MHAPSRLSLPGEAHPKLIIGLLGRVACPRGPVTVDLGRGFAVDEAQSGGAPRGERLGSRRRRRERLALAPARRGGSVRSGDCGKALFCWLCQPCSLACWGAFPLIPLWRFWGHFFLLVPLATVAFALHFGWRWLTFSKIFCRSAWELRRADWSEIDLDQAEWGMAVAGLRGCSELFLLRLS